MILPGNRGLTSRANMMKKPTPTLNWRANLLGEFLGTPQVAELLAINPVTDEQRVTTLLGLANGDPMWDSVWNAMQDGTTNDTSVDAAIQREILEGDLWRGPIIPALENLLPDTDAKAQKSRISAAESLLARTNGTLISIPTVGIRNGQFHLLHRVIASGPGGAIGYAFALASTTFALRLRRCRHSACNKFFLTPNRGTRPGRRRDTFCSQTCATHGARERIRNHMRAKRAKHRSCHRGGRR